MSCYWPTKNKDLKTARLIMQEYASHRAQEGFGIFELVFDSQQNLMKFRISGWVTQLAKHFVMQYGTQEGDLITRKVISNCMTQGQTIH